VDHRRATDGDEEVRVVLGGTGERKRGKRTWLRLASLVVWGCWVLEVMLEDGVDMADEEEGPVGVEVEAVVVEETTEETTDRLLFRLEDENDLSDLVCWRSSLRYLS